MTVAPLFLPADKLDRLAKALASGADTVILDLEDGVGPGAKAAARAAIAALPAPASPITIRINAAGTPWHDDDLAMLRALVWRPAVMITKAERPAAMRPAGIGPVWALIESAAGLAAARAIAAAGINRLVFGTADFSTDLGIAHEREPMLAARSELVLASRLAGLPPPIDGVCTDLNDIARIEAEARYALALGFGGKLCLHPRQIAPVLAGFRPSEDEIAWARRVVAAGGEGAIAIDGEMVDAPIRARAARLLARAAGRPQ